MTSDSVQKTDKANSVDIYNLDRFLSAQEDSYETALAELKTGSKRSHWMWFIFPQIEGLGKTEKAMFYAIKNLKEAQAFLSHPVLGQRLIECAQTVLEIDGRSASEIFGYPDDLKLKSSMTLFEKADSDKQVFSRILDKFFNGQRDDRTLALLS